MALKLYKKEIIKKLSFKNEEMYGFFLYKYCIICNQNRVFQREQSMISNENVIAAYRIFL